MSWRRSLTLLLALVALVAVAVPRPVQAASAPSAKRCKALKAKERKTRRDRATLNRCAKAAASKKKKKNAVPKPDVASESAPSSSAPVGPAPASASLPPVATPSPAPSPVPGPIQPAPTPVVPDLPTGTGRAVQVRGFEFGLSLSRAQVLSGTVRVEYNLTSAEDPHSLELRRTDGTGSSYRFDEQGSGTVVAKSLPLTAGRWRLVCDLPGHAAAGMQVDLEVR